MIRCRAQASPSPAAETACSSRLTCAEVPRGDTAGAMMTLTDVRVTVGDRDLLVGANLRVEPGETVGLVGANGCGKSTLLRCVSGLRSHDAGELRVAQRADVGYLEQTAVSGSKLTVAQEARSRMTHVQAAIDAVREAEKAMAEGDANAASMLVAANDAFEAVGGNTVERRVADVLTGLGFAKEAWDRPCAALSGGWQMRVALARLLLSPAGDSRNSGITGGFLLLDEPTNHLDAQAKEWLAGWLRAYSGTVLLVSHDEALLDKGVDRLVEVRGSRLHGYSGNYAKFLEERKQRREVAARAASKEAAKAAKLEQFVAKNSARASTAKAAKSKAKQLQGVLENLEELEELTGGGKDLGAGPGDAKRVTFRLPDPPDGAKEALILENGVVGYGAGLEPLITGAGLKVSRGDRWLIVGPNGAGKSTLLRTLGGNLRLQGGTLAHGEGTRVGYFSQDLAQELPVEETPLVHVLKVARAADPTVTELTARSVLGALGLSGSAAKDRKIGELSGGEKARVALAAFVLRPVNVLLLDEASNHLDTAAIDALTGALRGWDGAVVAVTHNKTFADALEPTFVARVEAGAMKTRMVTGGTLSKKDFSPNAVATGGVAGAVAKPKEAPKGAKKEQEMTEEEIAAAEAAAKEAKAARDKLLREARNAPKTIDKIERALAVLEDDIAAIDERLMKCGSDVAAAVEIQKEKDVKVEKQSLYYAEWERLEEVMAEAEAIAAEA